MEAQQLISANVYGHRSKIVKLLNGSINPPVTIFGDKFVPGGDSADGRCDLSDMLLTEWPTDVHYTQYVSPTDIRQVHDSPTAGVEFHVAAIDLDFDNHKSKPVLMDFADLLRVASVTDLTPNIVHQTRGGARWIWLIQPITDPIIFEQHYQGLIDMMAGTLERSLTNYRVDKAAKDWTRMFRAPRVVRDGVADYQNQVGIFHTKILDLKKLKPPRKRERTPQPLAKVPPMVGQADGYVQVYPAAISGNRGHNTTFKLACILFKQFKLDVEQARQLMATYNTRCDPPWSEQDLEHKVQDAFKAVYGNASEGDHV
jgi:hypothetical protein